MKTSSKDYYKLLGVEPDATNAQIKSAYRKLAKQYHPDVNTSGDAADRFREITEAYDTLTDPDRRRRYDRLHGTSRTTFGGDDEWSRYTRSGGGTHTGPAFDDFLIGALPAASGRKMRFTGTTVIRVENGRIAEEIGLDDGVTALTQLGIIQAV